MQLVAPAIARARKLGLPLDEILATFGLALADLEQPDFRLAFDTASKLWDEIARRSGSASFGLEAGLDLPVGHFDLHEYLVRCSPTLGAGLRRAFQFVALASTRGHLEVEAIGDELRIVNRPPAITSRHSHDCILYTIVTIVRRAAGRQIPLVRLELMASEPATTTLLRATFACPIVFAQPANVIVFARKYEDLELPARDARLAALIERHARAMVEALGDDRASTSDRVRRSLFQYLQTEHMTLERVARTIGVSARTLQRELRDEGTSFRDLVDEVRRDIAISHMANSDLPITSIAMLLDFSDVSAFHRSFRRWTGQAPAAYRAALRA